MATSFKKSMSYVMRLAWRFVKKFFMTMAEALKLAWKNYKLRNALHNSDKVVFTFKKVNGEIRHAVGTLSASVLSFISGNYSTYNTPFGNQTYWDLEKNDWRSFKCETLLNVSLA